MKWLGNLRLRFKLLLLNSVIYALALLVASGFWVTATHNSLQASFVHRINIQASVVATSLNAALMFDDALTVHETLVFLEVDTAMVSASVFDTNGKLLAIHDYSNQAPIPNKLMSKLFGPSIFQSTTPISFVDNEVGTLVIEASRAEVLDSTTTSIFLITLVLFLTLFLSALLSLRGLGWILKPIEQLSGLANRVKMSKNYSLRAPAQYPDEVGELAKEFNAMLNMIEQRDQFLESEVSLRTLELAHQATHDFLTRLPNRRGLQQYLEDLLLKKPNTEAHALLLLDLDQFKIINDTCGHAGGDQLLRKLAVELNSGMSGRDYLARLGGDEFAVVLHCIDEQTMAIRAEELRIQIEKYHFEWEGLSFNIRVSIGALMFQPSEIDVASLMKKADVACFTAKDKGRNRTYLINDGDTELTQRHHEMRIVQKINNAISNDYFVLFQQPIVSLASDPSEQMKYGQEILLRLKDPKFDLLADPTSEQLIMPNEFLPAAGRYGLSANIDKWVISKVIHLQKHHMSMATKVPTYWVNLCTTSICDSEFIDFLAAALETAALPRGCLIFEITETGFIETLHVAADNIRRIQKLGGLFALDDFGSGASSFRYLQELPLDYLKIDGSFICNLMTSETDYAITRSIIEIARTMQLEVVAEHVEDEFLLKQVQALGADFAQGWALGKPEIIKLP